MAEIKDVLEVLATFKKSEKERGEVVHPLVRDPILRNLIVIWTMIPVKLTAPKGAVPESENEKWIWLWGGAQYTKEAIGEYLKLDRMNLSRLMDRAIAFRLIYPDGTSNGLAIQYVRGEIARSMQKKPGPAGSGTP